MKKSDDAVKIARYISEFFDVYAPNFLTTSGHTLKSYRDALGLYINFLETESVTPGSFSRHCFVITFPSPWGTGASNPLCTIIQSPPVSPISF